MIPTDSGQADWHPVDAQLALEALDRRSQTVMVAGDSFSAARMAPMRGKRLTQRQRQLVVNARDP